MDDPLRALIVDDSADDAELIALELRRGGFALVDERVASAPALRDALRAKAWDVVVSDYVMPGFGGIEALGVVRDAGVDVPFILVSGAIPDETAAAAMKAGCDDYVSKQNLARLAPAVRRELREAQVRRERKKAQEALAFLADASMAFASSLDYDATIEIAASLAVPRIAEWCLIDVLDEAGRARRFASKHDEPAKARLLRELEERYPPDDKSRHPAAFVFRSGRALLLEEVGEAELMAHTTDEEHARILRDLGIRTAMVAPLVAHGRTLGTITLASGLPAARYCGVDLGLAEELGRRAGLAIENSRLYRDAREQARRAEQLYEEARAAVRLRDEFLAVASHELKTPLTTLKMQADIVQRAMEAGTSLAPEWLGKNMAAARRQIDRLTLLINNLLDATRLGEGRIDLVLDEVDLVATVREVAARFGHELERAGRQLEIHATGPVVGRWDGFRIEQVITNLLSNAVKFGASKPIDVTVEQVGDKDAKRARLSVRDRGMGIAPEDVERVFGRFERAVSVRHYGGLGLGLFITRQIVEAHGGTISVESRPGAGSTFAVELPLEGPRPAAERPAGRPALTAATDFYQQIFDHVAHPIFVKDRSYRFVLINRALSDMLGYSPAQMIGKTDYDFFPKEQSDFFRRKDQHMFETATTVVIDEEPITDSSGKLHVLATTKVPLRGPTGEVTHLVGIIHDITRLKEAEGELLRANQELARQIKETRSALEQRDGLNAELEAFNYSVSHDLRAPLRAIEGFCGAVAEDHASGLDETAKSYIARARAAAARMQALIDDMLVLSRVTRTDLRIGAVDLSPIARAVAAGLEQADPARRVHWAIPDEAIVRGDPDLVRIALENLLANAWKFTSQRAEAHIELGVRSEAGERVVFVRDDGAGFDPAYADKLFRPFARLHTAEQFPGTGIGLATVARIVRRHGGRVWAEGAVGRGATFYFSVPEG